MSNLVQILLDLPELESQIGETIRSYADLGNAIRQSSSRAQNSAASLKGQGSKDVPGALLADNADVSGSLERSLHVSDAQGRLVSGKLKKLEEFSFGGLLSQSGGPSGRGAARRAPDAIPVNMDQAAKEVDAASKAPGRVMTELNKVIDFQNRRVQDVAKFLQKEAASIKTQIHDLLRKVPGKAATGFIGGLIGSMVLGYTERDRRRKEMGEMANIFEGGVDSLFSSAGRKATRWFANWGERSQWQWGVGRKEVQGAAQLMVDNGFKISEMMGKVDSGLGHVGKNVVTLALGIGKHYNFSTTESMEDITSLVRDYGTEIDHVTSFYTKLTAAGARSGIGVRTFTRMVMSASAPLSRMGVNAENAAVFVSKVINFYEEAGLDKRYAGRQAEGVVADLATAFSRLDENLKIVLSREVYDDEESGAVSLMIKFDDGLRRVSEGESDEFLERLIRSFVKIARDRTAPGRSEGIYAVKGLLGVGNRTAQLVWDAGEKISEGGKLEELDKRERRELRKAFKTESTLVSRLHKTRREMIRGTAMMGEATLSLLVDLSALLMIGLKSLWAMASSSEKNNAILSRTYGAMNKIFDKMATHWDELSTGSGVLVTAMGAEFKDTYNPVLGILRGGGAGKPKNLGAEFEKDAAAVERLRKQAADDRKKNAVQSPIEGALRAGWQWVTPQGNVYSGAGKPLGVVPGATDAPKDVRKTLVRDYIQEREGKMSSALPSAAEMQGLPKVGGMPLISVGNPRLSAESSEGKNPGKGKPEEKSQESAVPVDKVAQAVSESRQIFAEASSSTMGAL